MDKGRFGLDTIRVGYVVRTREGCGRVVDLWGDCNQWYIELLIGDNGKARSIQRSHVLSIIGMKGETIRLSSNTGHGGVAY